MNNPLTDCQFHIAESLEQDNIYKYLYKHKVNYLCKLSQAKAKVIAFDMYFKTSTEFDQTLAKAMIQAKDRGTDIIVGINDFKRGEAQLANKLKQAVSNFGALCISEEEVKKFPLVIIKQDETLIYSFITQVIEAILIKRSSLWT